MKAFDWKMLTLVLTLATLFRFWGAFDYNEHIGDEAIIVPNAISVIKYGTTTEWKYPQMNSLIVAGTISMFGNNSVGWRMSGIVLGIATILLVYLIARQLYADNSIALLAASLLAFDPFHIHFCRTAMIETAVIFFFLLFLYLMLEFSENGRSTLTLAGIAMGFTIATKAYFVFAIPVVVLYAFYREYQRNGKVVLISIEFVIKLILLPLSIYLFSYIFWFGRGYTLAEFFQFRFDAYWLFNNNFKFANEQILAQGGKPWEWFVKPISFGHHLFSDGIRGRYAIEINNPLFRMMVFPALGIVLFHAIKTRILNWFLAPLLFAACYLLFFITNRVFNSYSALALLPFAYLVLAHAIIITAKKYLCEKEVTLLFICIIFASGCYLFPLTAAFLVPSDLYKPILSITNLTRVF